MTYAGNLTEEVINSQFFCVLKPRKKILHSEFTLDAGSVYEASFTLGRIVAVKIDGTALAAGSSASLSAGQFYYDSDAEILYIRKADSSAPGSGDFIVATFELYYGTFDAHFYRIPTDNTSAVVYFEPIIVKSPVISQSSTDNLFGFYPTKSTTIELANAEHTFEELISTCSFNKAEIKMYHLLGEVSSTNARLVFSGLMGTISYSGDNVLISVLDETDIFNQEYRHASGSRFYNTTDFANLDPSYIGSPIREVFGYVEGFIPVNTRYGAGDRIWAVKRNSGNLGSVTKTVTTGSTTTTTVLTSAVGINVGDQVWLDRVSGVDDYAEVTAVDYGTNTITHIAWPLGGGAATSGDSIKRGFVGRVDIIQNGVKYSPLYEKHFTINTSLGSGLDIAGFTLSGSTESDLGMTTLTPNDIVYCRVYGDLSDETLGGSPFGAADTQKGILTQGVVILYRLLKTKLGLTESEIDTAAFTTLQSDIADTVGFAVPRSVNDSFPTYKEIVNDLLQTLMLRMFKDEDGKWTFAKIAPLGAYSKEIQDDEIVRNSLRYDFDYNDLLDEVIVEYKFNEVGDSLQIPFSKQVTKSRATIENPEYLHSVKKQKTFNSVHYSSTYADVMAERLSYIFGERKGLLTIRTKNRFFDVNIGDVIRVTREKLPGYAYVDGTDRTEDFVVIDFKKSLNEVTLTLDDQKGIEDNSGSW